ncbi:Protein CBG25267 [Caenorhabditis briggsae]|jgi:hypothetical protein
MSNF